MRPGRRHGEAGQATIEVLTALPLLLAIAVLALQMAGVVGAALEADRVAREEAIAAARDGRAAVGGHAVAPLDLLPGPGRLVIERRLVSDCPVEGC